MEKITRRENMLRTFREHKNWFIPTVSDMDMILPTVLKETPMQPGRSQDDWGVTWLLLEGQPGPIQDEKLPPVLEDVTEWREVVHFPDYDSYDWEGCAAADTASWDRENRMSNVIIVNGMWERFYALCGFQNALCNLLVEPEETFALLSAIADSRVECIRKMAKYYKPDMIQLHDDYGTEKSLFMSVEVWRELIKPNLQKIVDVCKELGIIYNHHSCGYIAPLIDDFLEMGIEVWNPVQYTNKPEELAEKYAGKFTFVGGFNDRIFVSVSATKEDKMNSISKSIDTFEGTGSWLPYPTMDLAGGDFSEYIEFLHKEIYRRNKPIYDELGLTGPGFEEPVGNTFKSAYYKVEE